MNIIGIILLVVHLIGVVLSIVYLRRMFSVFHDKNKILTYEQKQVKSEVIVFSVFGSLVMGWGMLFVAYTIKNQVPNDTDTDSLGPK